jgi:hypothetical protein
VQIDETTDVVKGAHLIMYVQYVVDMIHRRNLLFWKPTDGRASYFTGSVQYN